MNAERQSALHARAVGELPRRAKKVGELANEHAAYADREGRLAQPVVDALHADGLYGMWGPESIGGG